MNRRLTWSVEPHPHVEEKLADLPPGRAVELGCGEGRQAIWLASHGWRVTAVDFSPVAVDRGRKIAERHGIHVGWVVADVLDYALPVPLDLAMILYLHIRRDEFADILSKAAAALAPGGTLFVLGWDRQNVTDGIDGPQHPEVLYSVDDLARSKGCRWYAPSGSARPGRPGPSIPCCWQAGQVKTELSQCLPPSSIARASCHCSCTWSSPRTLPTIAPHAVQSFPADRNS
ncbi:MAG: class I SAM-dependent methyltransferase [Pseudonocardiaceae bacterium]